VIYDAVTLFHFAVVGRLDVLELRHGHRPPPRWTEAVRDEISVGAAHGMPGAQTILDASWLDAPISPSSGDLRGITMLQVGLNDGQRPPTKHAGEAESIYFAEKLDAIFVTDDNAAYDFAIRRLGAGQVIDTVALLQEAVSMDELSAGGAADLANEILAADRYLRRTHPKNFSSNDFQ